jgi:hypothetical protein
MKGRFSVKKLLSVSFCIALVCAMGVSLNGCKEPAKAGDKKELKASTPEMVTVKQGAEGTATVKITLGSEIKLAKLEVADADKKVTAKLDASELKATGDAKVTFTVAADADPKEYTAILTTKAEGATPAEVKTTRKVKVDKK